MEKLTPTTNFRLWKLRVIPLLTAKTAKWGLKDEIDLLPTVLDDTLCTVFGQWLVTTTDRSMDKALDFLSTWLITEQGHSSEPFLSRKWCNGETLEKFV